MGGAGHPSVSATGGPDVGPARKRNVTVAGLDSSPGSVDVDDIDEADNREEKKRLPVKRACNECRQQKVRPLPVSHSYLGPHDPCLIYTPLLLQLRCDVKQDPWVDCSRCRRLKLDCKIETTFKRVGKRSRNAEMEREIIALRKQIAHAQANATATLPPQPPSSLPTTQPTPKQETSTQVSPVAMYHTPSAISSDQYMGSHEAVASLLDLRSGFDGSNYMRNGNHHFKRLEDVAVVPERVTELFDL